MSARPFEIICEIEPPVRPDLTHARHQIGVLTAVSSTFLIPDNHIGRATVSSIAVAHEVQAMGGHSIACINSRDRNLLGFRRDLLTAAAYGVSQFLFVYGDKPGTGGRTSDLTVRSMIGDRGEATDRPHSPDAIRGSGTLPLMTQSVRMISPCPTRGPFRGASGRLGSYGGRGWRRAGMAVGRRTVVRRRAARLCPPGCQASARAGGALLLRRR